MTQSVDIPPPPATVPASPIARDVELVVERVMLKMVELVNARADRDMVTIAHSNEELRDTLKRILDELLSLKRKVEFLEVRVTAHDAQIAAILTRPIRAKGKRRAAKSR